MRDRRPRPRGVALVIVLWVLALLAVVVLGFAVETRSGLRIARNHVESARARALADAGVSLAIAKLTTPNPEIPWPADGRSRVFFFGEGEIRVSVQDEGGKVDLNTAPDDLLAGLFLALDIAPDVGQRLVDAIDDWKDPDDLRRPNGAEADDYRAAGLPYGPRNGPFESVDELRLVLGMTRDLYRRVSPFVTVYSRSARVNPMTAPPAVLRAIPGLAPALVDAYVEARSRQTASDAATALPPLSGGTSYMSRLATGAVSIRSEALLAGSGTRYVRSAIVRLSRRGDVPFSYLSWRQEEEDVRDPP